MYIVYVICTVHLKVENNIIGIFTTLRILLNGQLLAL